MGSPSLPEEARGLRRWIGLAIGVLLLAGVFALILVFARMPPFDRLITDPLFFRRCLVVHVNLALVVWFYAFVAGLMQLVPKASTSGVVSRVSPIVAAIGVAIMGLAAALPGAAPVLSNYVPMIDHPLFGLGQAVFAAGVLASFLDGRMLVPASEDRGWLRIDGGAVVGLRATGVALVLAALTFVGGRLEAPEGVTPDVWHELVHWGGGHVLQLASETAMVSVWLMLLGSLLGRPAVSRPVASALFAALVGPWMVAPVLPFFGTQTATYMDGFTSLMRFAIFPVVLVFLALCLRALWQARGELGRAALRDPRLTGFLASAGLTVLGFVIGALIRGSSTIIPAHYHASIGAVTVAFMAASPFLLAEAGLPLPSERLRRVAVWQPPLYGVGQMVFATGFALAGAYGMARKVYGVEQADRGLMETVGLVVMGVGGLVAAAGGLAFLWLVLSSWLHQRAGKPVTRSTAWNPPPLVERTTP